MYDVIIVGVSFSGSILSKKLAEEKIKYKWFNWHKENCEYTTVVTEYPLQYNKDAEVGNLPNASVKPLNLFMGI